MRTPLLSAEQRGPAVRLRSQSEGRIHVRTRASMRITTILVYILAILIILQGMMMFFPITAIRIALEIVWQDHQRRKRQVEWAQDFPDVWVQHIIEVEEKPTVVWRTIVGMQG